MSENGEGGGSCLLDSFIHPQHNIWMEMTSDGTTSVRCGFQLARLVPCLPPFFVFHILSKDRRGTLHEEAWNCWVPGPMCKNGTNCPWLVFIKFEVMLLSATPTPSALKLLAQRRQLHTINTALAGFAVTAIKASSGGDGSGTTCAYLCMRQGYVRLLSS